MAAGFPKLALDGASSVPFAPGPSVRARKRLCVTTLVRRPVRCYAVEKALPLYLLEMEPSVAQKWPPPDLT